MRGLSLQLERMRRADSQPRGDQRARHFVPKGSAWNKTELIGLAYDFEQETQHRWAPEFLPEVAAVPPMP